MRSSRRAAILGLIVATLLASDLCAQDVGTPVDAEWGDKWFEDLVFLDRELRERHPDPYHWRARASFDQDLTALAGELGSLAHHEVVVRLAALYASLGDGHTRVTLPVPADAGVFQGHSRTPPPALDALRFRFLPIRLLLLEDGWIVDRVERRYGDIAGAELLRIGDLPVADVAERVSAVVHRDNEQQLLRRLPDFVIVPEVLHALGIIPAMDTVNMTVRTPSGTERTVALSPVADGAGLEWVEASEARPRYQRNVATNYWFERIEGTPVVYVQYNEAYDEPGEDIPAFTRRLFAFMDEQPVSALVFDLRHNRGGSNGNNLPFLHGLIRCSKLTQPGSLFVLIGGRTFSAATMLAVDVEAHTPALFVGETTGGAPNHFGDSYAFQLPNTGLTARISTLEWQYSDPRDERPGVQPHVPVAVTMADHRNGRDPVLARVLQAFERDPGGVSGSWRGAASFFYDMVDVGVTFGENDGGRSALVDVPAYGVHNQPATEVRVTPDRVAFACELAGRPVRFEAVRAGSDLCGVATRGAKQVPFILTATAR